MTLGRSRPNSIKVIAHCGNLIRDRIFCQRVVRSDADGSSRGFSVTTRRRQRQAAALLPIFRPARVTPDASFPTHSIGMIDEIMGGRMLPMTRAGLGAATTELSR